MSKTGYVSIFGLILAATTIWLAASNSSPHQHHSPANPVIDRSGPVGLDDGRGVSPITTIPFMHRDEETSTTDQVLVTVRDSADEAVVPNAQVFLLPENWWSDQQPSKAFRELGQHDGHLSYCLRGATKVKADSSGRLLVPSAYLSGSTARLLALDDGYLGMPNSFHMEGSEGTLQVHRNKSITVWVQDQQGRPVPGVSVAIRQMYVHCEPQEWRPDYHYGTEFIRQRTDEKGCVVLPHAKALASNSASWRRLNQVALSVPFIDDTFVVLDPQKLPNDPIVLILPKTREITVKVRTAEGLPPPKGTLVSLGYFLPPGVTETMRPGTAVVVCDEHGNAHFPHAGVNAPWQVRAWHPDWPQCVTVDGVQNPPASAPSVIDVEWISEHPTLTGRIVSESGEPVRNTRVQFSIWPSHDSDGKFNAQLDRHGEFRWDIPPVPTPTRLVVSRATSECVEAVRVDLPPLTSGEWPMGDIVLQRPELLVAGRIVDDRQQPIAGTKVSIQVEGTGDVSIHDTSPPPKTTTDSEGRYHFYEDLHWHWPRDLGDPYSGGVSNSDLQGAPPPTMKLRDHLVFRVEARRTGYLRSKSERFTRKQENLDLTMKRGAEVEVRLAVPSELRDASEIAVELYSPKFAKSYGQYRSTKSIADGFLVVHWPSLPAGDYGLVVFPARLGATMPPDTIMEITEPRTINEDWPLIYGWAIIGSSLPPAPRAEDKPPPPPLIMLSPIPIRLGENKDPRLQNLDLRPHFRMLTFSFRDEEGQMLAPSGLSFSGPFGRYEFWDLLSPAPKMTFLVPKDTVKVEVSANRCESTTQVIRADQVEVTLKRLTR